MKRRTMLAGLLLFPLAVQGGLLDDSTAAKGLQQALEQGTQQAVSLLGRENGYFRNARVKIPLPEPLAGVEKTLRRIGQGKVADEFILSMNRAAEAAAPEAKAVFLQVIRGMSVRDAVGIVRGPDDAATAYFRKHSMKTLSERFLPIVKVATDRMGVTRRYKKFLKEAGPAASLLDLKKLDLDDYVTRKALDGLFVMVADEEKRIRRDPVARTTDLLQKVFGK